MSKGDVVRTTWVGTPHAAKPDATPEKKAPKLKKGGKAMKTMKAPKLKKGGKAMKTTKAAMLKTMKPMGALKKAMK